MRRAGRMDRIDAIRELLKDPRVSDAIGAMGRGQVVIDVGESQVAIVVAAHTRRRMRDVRSREEKEPSPS